LEINVGGQIIQTVKYADDLVLMAKEETVLQGMIDKLMEIGRCYGMEMNVDKTKVMRISRQPSPVTIMIGLKQLESVENFKYLGMILTNDGRCTREIKSRIAMAKVAFFKHAAESLFLFLQNTAYFIMLPFLVLYYSQFTYRCAKI
jgi:hypothetical protein